MDNMTRTVQKVAVLGSGSWGTALASHLRRAGHSVVIWGKSADEIQDLAVGRNTRYFPGETLASGLVATTDLLTAVDGAQTIVIAVPSFAVREVCESVREHAAAASIVSAAKGLEGGSFRFLSEVVGDVLGNADRVAVLSGPSFALEVLRNKPTAVTVASRSEQTAKRVAETFHHETFRVYTTADVVGVEVGGAVKNVIALAVGMVDGFDGGTNARAALITRGLAEIAQLADALGGESRTVSGLSGLGDLLLTATGDLSRNRTVGLRLGKGETLGEILASLGQVAEGVEAAPKVLALATKRGVAMPITEAVVKVISGERSVQDSARMLLSRERKGETSP